MEGGSDSWRVLARVSVEGFVVFLEGGSDCWRVLARVSVEGSGVGCKTDACRLCISERSKTKKSMAKM